MIVFVITHHQHICWCMISLKMCIPPDWYDSLGRQHRNLYKHGPDCFLCWWNIGKTVLGSVWLKSPAILKNYFWLFVMWLLTTSNDSCSATWICSGSMYIATRKALVNSLGSKYDRHFNIKNLWSSITDVNTESGPSLHTGDLCSAESEHGLPIQCNGLMEMLRCNQVCMKMWAHQSLISCCWVSPSLIYRIYLYLTSRGTAFSARCVSLALIPALFSLPGEIKSLVVTFGPAGLVNWHRDAVGRNCLKVRCTQDSWDRDQINSF